MTRLWLLGSRIIVVTGQDLPRAFMWEQHEHRVTYIAQKWRWDIEWWRVRIWRDYYKLVTDTGMLVVVYHDLLQDTWFIQRLYD